MIVIVVSSTPQKSNAWATTTLVENANESRERLGWICQFDAFA